MAKAKTGFGTRLADSGKWREKTNMDRFVTLVFLTAEEKRNFCKRMFLDEGVDYLDGDDIATLTIKPEDEQRSVPSGQFVVGAKDGADDGEG